MPKKAVFRCQPPKTDFTFLIYTGKNIYLKKIKCQFTRKIPIFFISMYYVKFYYAIGYCQSDQLFKL